MKKMVSILLCIVILFGFTDKCNASEQVKESELFAKSAVLMDADSGRILYEKNGHEELANASTTKILTCIVALENCDPDSVVTVSSRAAAAPKVHLGMREGQQFYIRDLLYGLMLESFNDCAVAIAEHIGGSVEDFAKLMNDKAAEIGCTNTHFVTPNGLDAADDEGIHHTTAADLALIMRYCIKLSPKTEEFLAITGTGQYSFCELKNGGSYSCYNHNAFLQMMEGALSGKTGFTGQAGYCYVGSLKRDECTYIVALLACGWPNNKSYKWADTKKLMNYGIENFEKKKLDEIVLDAQQLEPIPVANAQGERIGSTVLITPVVTEETGIEELLLRPEEQVRVDYRIADKLYAPVEAGTCLGKITYLLGEECLREYTITAKEHVFKIDYRWCLEKTAQLLWL